ncbi:MAG: class II aldolase/adducin family protein [Halofilum sp. (in: g-proteobacteria)]
MADPRVELIDYYRLLRRYGYNDSHSGNGSVRLDDTAWVTPTGACGDTLTADALVGCPLDAPPPAGASLDAALHMAVYHARPEARAVLHSHGPHAIALSLAGEDFVPVDFEGAAYFPRVPVLDIAYADYVSRSPVAVAAALAEHAVAIVRGHGVYAWGETLDRAYKWNCSLEASARIAWLARVAGIDAPD